MSQLSQELLRRLGRGESIDDVCREAGYSRREFDARWEATARSRVPVTRDLITDVSNPVSIGRDSYGIPHIHAENETDLFFAFGFAMAEDRLFQMDYLRRKARGQLAEVLGEQALAGDCLARTVGLGRIAEAEWATLRPAVQDKVVAFARGVNAFMDGCSDSLPIEFDLLDYRPTKWLPVDCLAIEVEFRWYLTGRFPIIVIPELARRTLGDGPLYQQFVLGEADEEPIVWDDEFDAAAVTERVRSPEEVGQAVNDPDAAIGSNNWVVGGRRAPGGKALLASDPHIAFEAVSCWYEVHLSGGPFQVAGMGYVGMPAVMFGRNEQIAWGITNNICSQRDLYQEQTHPEHPNCFLYEGQWETARTLTENIAIRDADPVEKTIVFSRNGPIVDDLLPMPEPPAKPVSLKWLGAYQGGWLTALLDVDTASSIDEFREALRPWHVPTFSMVVADVAGNIGFQTAGRVPLRSRPERGFRDGSSSSDQWLGLIPFEAMPRVESPRRDWIASANNRLASESFPLPLHGCWSSGWRAVRIRQLLEEEPAVSVEHMQAMQQDHRSLRAADLLPSLLTHLEGVEDPAQAQALQFLKDWDSEVTPQSVAASVFNRFFARWSEEVLAERFEADLIPFVIGGIHGCAGRLLKENVADWFSSDGDRIAAIQRAFGEAVRQLSDRFGDDVSQWTWGRFHVMPLRHVLADRGELAGLLNFGGQPVGGDMWTVGNTGCGPDFEALTGAGYRMVVDLASSPPALMAVDGQGQSGHPGSPHYRDQFDDWLQGRYHVITLTKKPNSEHRQRTLQPKKKE